MRGRWCRNSSSFLQLRPRYSLCNAQEKLHKQIESNFDWLMVPQLTPMPGALSGTNRLLMRPCAEGCGLPGFSPLHRCDCACNPPCCGARHEALNEAFFVSSGWIRPTGSRAGHGRVIFTEKLTAQAFEVLQVIPRHCLLMEFSVRWVSGLSE